MGQLLGCRLCDALLFASLPLFPSLLWVRRLCDALLFHSLLLARRTCDALLFPSLLLRRPVSLGPLSGFAWRLQSPVETGTPARRRSEVTLFLNRLDCCQALAMPDAPLQAIPDALMGSKSPFNPRRALGRD